MIEDEELKAQSDHVYTPGLIVVLDLDRFGEYVEKHGLDPYRPNAITGELTRLIEEFTWRHRGVVIYGLDYERGTEEAIVEIPYGYGEMGSVTRDLELIKSIIEKHGVSISIVVLRDHVTCRPARNRREAYHGTPGRRRAMRKLRALKRRGGGRLVILA